MPHRTHLPVVRFAAMLAMIACGAVAAPVAASDPVVVVQPGDTLSEIGVKYGVTVAQLRALNGIADPNRIYAGQRLRLTAPAAIATTAPTPAGGDLVHVVVRGQTLTGIARQYGSTIAAIVQANAIANPSFLRVGQRLTIPGVPSPSAAASAPASIASLAAARGEIGAIIRAEARSQGVPVAFALAVAWHESGWRPTVISRAGAVGVMQLTPATADWVAGTMLGHRVDLYDASSNVQAGVALLRHYLDRYQGDRTLVLAAYYQGQTAADRHGVYGMTRPYIASILALEKLFGS
jgi:soluble lytic murein transglycosylase-like protein